VIEVNGLLVPTCTSRVGSELATLFLGGCTSLGEVSGFEFPS
jgi:hypothetical protein